MISNSKTILKPKFLFPVIVFLMALVGLFIVLKNKNSFFDSQLFMSSSDLIQEFNGSYYMGDGLGVNCNFEIMPDSTFKIRWVADGGGRADFSGKISVQNMRFVLDPIQQVETPAPCFHKTFIPIRWGDRKYLLPDDKDEISNYIVSFFCERVKNGREPRNDIHGFSYLRKTDITIKVEGNPLRLDGQLQCP